MTVLLPVDVPPLAGFRFSDQDAFPVSELA
jgi:hypothetical protein